MDTQICHTLQPARTAALRAEADAHRLAVAAAPPAAPGLLRVRLGRTLVNAGLRLIATPGTAGSAAAFS